MTHALKQKLIDIASNEDVIAIKKKPVANMGFNALDAQSVFDTVMPLLRAKKILFSTRDVKINKTAIIKKGIKNIKGTEVTVEENYIHIEITGTAVFTDAETNEEFLTEYFGFAEDKMDKAMPQANTIARKYALSHAFHIYGEADPEAKGETLSSIKAYITVKKDEIVAIAHSVEEPEKPTIPAKIFYEKPEELEALQKVFKENGYIFHEQYKTWSVPRVKSY